MNIILVIVFSVLVAAAFIGTFFYTGQTWDATNAAGVVCLVYVILFLYRATRPPVSSKLQRWVLGIVAVVILGLTIAWITMYRMTNFQYDRLHVIRKTIFHGSTMDKLKANGLRTLSKYYERSNQNLSLGEIFRKENPHVAEDGLIESDPDAKTKLLAASVTDTMVVLVCQATIRIDGEDPAFVNLDGHIGMTQAQLIVTKKGLVYEIQN